jgi:hypothetical protein
MRVYVILSYLWNACNLLISLLSKIYPIYIINQRGILQEKMKLILFQEEAFIINCLRLKEIQEIFDSNSRKIGVLIFKNGNQLRIEASVDYKYPCKNSVDVDFHWEKNFDYIKFELSDFPDSNTAVHPIHFYNGKTKTLSYSEELLNLINEKISVRETRQLCWRDRKS